MPTDAAPPPDGDDPPPLIPPTPPHHPAFARVVDTEGRVISLHIDDDYQLTLTLEMGRGTFSRTLDRFQTQALVSAVDAADSVAVHRLRVLP